MRLLPVVAILAGSFLAPAYGATPWCTLESRPSVVVTINDASGNPQPNASVSFTIDGGPVQQAESYCWQEPCNEWWAGEEQEGLFTITAVGTDGTNVTGQVQVVREDRCHIHTENMTLVLP